MFNIQQRHQLAERLSELLSALPPSKQQPEMQDLVQKFREAGLLQDVLRPDQSDPDQFSHDLIETPEMSSHLVEHPQIAEIALKAKAPEQFADNLL